MQFTNQSHGDGFELSLRFPCRFCPLGMFSVVGVAHHLFADFCVALSLFYAFISGYFVAII
ncbi:hypothetical protein, partial [Sphingobacterium siyangense]|uniref:hypothetical protein n=1 Tax=Sphingobacterium siyangense TaxID=459529 RepID=UPI003DA37882